jgi:1-acyl-sn-glycerol-3-phosphate acyltransferase
VVLDIFSFFYCNNILDYFWIYIWAPILCLPIIYALWFAVILILLFLTSYLFSLKKEIKKPDRFALWLSYVITHQLSIFARIHIHCKGFDKLPKDGKYLIIYNHRSNWDPMLIMDKMHKYHIICITKPENEKIPIAGRWIHRAGFIAIDRQNNVKALSSIYKAIDFLNKGYGSICVAPEGTRCKNGTLLNFHPGTFKIAFRAQVPIIEVGFKNTDAISKNFPFKNTHVEMEILRVIDYNYFKDSNTIELCNEVYKDFEDYLLQGGKI